MCQFSYQEIPRLTEVSLPVFAGELPPTQEPLEQPKQKPIKNNVRVLSILKTAKCCPSTSLRISGLCVFCDARDLLTTKTISGNCYPEHDIWNVLHEWMTFHKFRKSRKCNNSHFAMTTSDEIAWIHPEMLPFDLRSVLCWNFILLGQDQTT